MAAGMRCGHDGAQPFRGTPAGSRPALAPSGAGSIVRKEAGNGQPREEDSREGADMSAGTALRASLTIPGQPAHVKDAREFVTRTMGAGHSCVDVAVLLSSELVTNSLLHSGSGMSEGTVTITVTGIADGVRVEVLDAGGASVPHVDDKPAAVAEGGRGLCLVRELSASWGYRHEGAGVVTWFEVSAEPGPATEPHPPGMAPKQTAGTVTRPRPLTSCEGARS